MKTKSSHAQIITSHSIQSNWFKRWCDFIRERFALPEHLTLIAAICFGNIAVANHVLHLPYRPGLSLCLYVLCVAFFFKLRCFDEIKDYQTDLTLHPHRPLVRGLLSQHQVKVMIAVLTLFELGLIGFIGNNAFVSYSIAVAYSFLMYREFFICQWLSARLTAYAVSHTLVAMLLVYAVYSAVSGIFWLDLPIQLLGFGVSTWVLFNVYEFARKTFAASEERPGLTSYSAIYGIPKAVALTLSQAGFAVLLLIPVTTLFQKRIPGLTVTFGFPLGLIFLELTLLTTTACFGIYFMYLQNRKVARWFRAACAVFFIGFYALILSFALWEWAIQQNQFFNGRI